MTRFGAVMVTYFATMAIGVSAFVHPAPKLIWNASASVPIGLYRVRPAGDLHVTELVVVRPPPPLANFLDERGYLPKSVPLLKHILALPGQTVCRTGRTITVDAAAMGEALEHDRRGRPASCLARLPRHRSGRGLPHEPAVRGLPRRPIFRAVAGDNHRRRSGAPLDRRGAMTVSQSCPRTALQRQPSRPVSSSFPAIPPVVERRSMARRARGWRQLLCGGIAVALLTGGGVADAEPIAAKPPSVAATADQVAGFVAEASQRFGIPASWIRAVMRAESFGDVRALSPKGAMGLMQIMPATWAGLRLRYGLGADPYDAHDNIIAGAAYLRELHDRYGAPGFLAAYNAGPARYEDHSGDRPTAARRDARLRRRSRPADRRRLGR